MPLFFEQTVPGGTPGNKPNNNTPNNNETTNPACIVQFHAELCVQIKGEKTSVGNTNDGEEKLCTSKFAPIPLEISGSKVVIRGDKFPEIVVEGQGLPIPIIINGRGKSNGSSNIGAGTLLGNGDLTIEKFDVYVGALDSTGSIPNFLLTTGDAPAIEGMDRISGEAITPEGKLRLVGGTVLGKIFPSADEYLLGAGLLASFTGHIVPTIEECAGEVGRPTQIEVSKLIIDAQGSEVGAPVPNGSVLEVSNGTYISRDSTDIGAHFQSTAKFKITNITDQNLKISIPPRIGPFSIDSTSALNQSLSTDGSIILRVTFRPVQNLIEEAGKITETLQIGDDTLTLSGIALEPEGALAVDILDSRGNLLQAGASQADLGTIAVPASPQRAYMECQQQICGGGFLPIDCKPCSDVTSTTCQLYAVSEKGQPIDEVDKSCQAKYPNAQESLVINITSNSPNTPFQIIAIRNTGPVPIKLDGITLREVKNSRSSGEFIFQPTAVIKANDLSKVKDELVKQITGADGVKSSNSPFPITLPTYDPPHNTTRAFMLIGYLPTDLLGSDGSSAGVGTIVNDRANLQIVSGSGNRDLMVTASTTIKDIPALQAFFKTGTGIKERADGKTFAFQGITMETTDQAIPFYVQLSDSASNPARIVGIRITGKDAKYFEWLDAIEKIKAKPENVRCSEPIYDDQGNIIDVNNNLVPASLAVNGYDLTPGGNSVANIPFFGCVNFHRPEGEALTQRNFIASLEVTTQQLGANGKPMQNPDGTTRQSTFTVPLQAVVEPLHGKMVFRVTQTMAPLMNPQFPSVASSPSAKEVDRLIAAGRGIEADKFLFLSAIILDPFDEEVILDESGEIVSKPGDGTTVVYRAIDTRPNHVKWDDPFMESFSNIAFDASAPKGQQGAFFDYPNLPEDLKTNALKIFTASLSFPGPLGAPEDQPDRQSTCEQVDPCSAEGQRKHGLGPTEPGKRGVCAFFYISAGGPNSPAFHTAEELPGGKLHDLCKTIGEPEDIKPNLGTFDLDGHINMDVELRFWGPTYFHNPNGPLGNMPVLDEIWQMALSTDVLRPKRPGETFNALRNPRLNIAKQEYKINLTDPNLEIPAICSANTKNLEISGENYSTWRYLAPLLSKDEEGLIPAGCPESDNKFNGGVAYLRGRPINHETGITTVVGITKFSSNDDLTFAFKDIPIFIVLNGWACDPDGDPENFEGARCYDNKINERDIRSQMSLIE